MQSTEDQHFLNSPEPRAGGELSTNIVVPQSAVLTPQESEIVAYLKTMDDESRRVKKEKASRAMQRGTIWFFGGIALTFGYFGFLFWGFVVYGAIKFLRGLISYYK